MRRVKRRINALKVPFAIVCLLVAAQQTVFGQGCGAIVLNAATFAALQNAITTYNGCSNATDSVTVNINGIIVFPTTLTINNATGATLTLNGGGAAILDGNNAVQLFEVNNGTFNISALTLRNGNAGGDVGGAIENNGTLTVTDSTFAGNIAGAIGNPGDQGGAIYHSSGTATITNTVFEDNVADEGGAIFQLADLTVRNSTFRSNDARGAGGIDAVGGILNVSRSTFDDNFAAGTGAALIVRIGQTTTVTETAFINNESTSDGGAVDVFGNLNLTNATFSGNTTGGIGGAIRNINFGETTLLNTTVSGGGVYLQSGTLNLNNSILANAVGSPNCRNDIGTVNFSPDRSNLIETGNCGTPGTDYITADPQLAPLTGNPAYFPLLATSPAEGAGDNATCATVDIVGTARPVGNRCDLGAFELTAPRPRVANDFYSAQVGSQLSVGAGIGVRANDVNTVARTVELLLPPEQNNAFVLRADGSFNYTPSAPGVDGFSYTVENLQGGRSEGRVCITISDIGLTVPGQQTTDLDNTLAIRGIVVETDDPVTLVTVRLTVDSGTLRVRGADDGTVPSPADICRQELRTSAGGFSGMVSAGQSDGASNYGVEFVRTGFFQGDESTVTAEGNGTSDVTLRGRRDAVNDVLETLEFTPERVGVNRLVVAAEQGDRGNVAVGQVTIVVVGSGDESSVDTGDIDAETVALGPSGPPLGPNTLFEISLFPNTVVRGVATNETVPNGDVYVQVIAFGGTLVSGSEQVGDNALLLQSIETGAEVRGLTVVGGSVSTFNGNVTICLLGFGTFYYRDATLMPRETVILPATFDGRFTCAQIPNAGTVILIADDSPGTTTVMETDDAMTDGAEAIQTSALPDGCMVTTLSINNLREAPSMNGEVIRRIPFDVTLTAFEEHNGWYYVDYWGERGWMSADFVDPNGMC